MPCTYRCKAPNFFIYFFMKQLDQLLVRSFIGPFIVACGIAMFVLLMQVLWVYIDEFAGKDLGPFLIIELLGYRSVSLIPTALPLGMLLASVMVLGNMAERYELSSIKSAGVSLLRVMRPLILFGVGITLFSIYCSNTLIPIANLRFGSRLFDIKQQKPTLQMEAGTFNYDFKGYAIYIGQKLPDGRSIKDVLIYDHTRSNIGEITQIMAKEGEMYSAAGGKRFVMDLRDVHTYIETRPGGSSSNDGKYPYVRQTYGEWQKKFDLSEFELNRTNPELFKSNRQMMSSRQLAVAIDSIAIRIDRRETDVANYWANYIERIPKDSTYILEEMSNAKILGDSMAAKYGDQSKDSSLDTVTIIPLTVQLAAREKESKQKPQPKVLPRERIERKGGNIPEQVIDRPIEEYEQLGATFAAHERGQLYEKVNTYARSIHNQAQAAINSLNRMRESRVKHQFDLQSKYSVAVVCIIFLFIGAPMGAIIRKGGFGYPILIAIVFFVLFVVMTIFFRKLAESFVITGSLAAWMPCIVLFPIGVLLTLRATK